MELQAMFEKHEDEYLEFSRVEEKLHPRPDLCAFLLLDSLLPGAGDMVCAAEHEEIYLDVDCDLLADVATEADILTLVRCGVRYDDGRKRLAMFV